MARKCFFLLLLLAKLSSVHSQQIDSLLEIQRKADPQEKAYVQFDKPYYNPGETVWFKAYLFTGIEPSQESKNFYGEFLDEKGTLLEQVTAPIYFSGASGSFDLDSNFSKPVVFFRAYTVSMLNSDTSFLFQKAIRVLTSRTTKTATAQGAPTISFLPEGGDWVVGLPSTIAF